MTMAVVSGNADMVAYLLKKHVKIMLNHHKYAVPLSSSFSSLKTFKFNLDFLIISATGFYVIKMTIVHSLFVFSK